MMKLFRIFLAVFAVVLVAAAVALFFYAEQSAEKLDKTLEQVKQSAGVAYSSWEVEKQKGGYCLENKELCDEVSEQYSKQLDGWVQQVEEQLKLREQNLMLQYRQFFKELDEQFIPELNTNGLAFLATICIVLLLITLSIVYLLGGRQKGGKTSEKPVAKTKTMPRKETVRRKEAAPRRETASFTEIKTDLNTLLRKATECAESEPMQAISYLEQAIEGSLGTKLAAPALLLCGSLRLKNKIGEDRGREQLQELINAAPESSEAEKAQMVLDTFK
ncbi:MAG: hypothetical protein LBU89_09970 [Fibromonadaceae bacterium]|jgi:flagellar basal body-associated protein FliL|nr:hypothetical protein [Fibromonadaceae bacterium]